MRKNPHAVALGRLGGRATKGISTPAKREAARSGARARWARPVPQELRAIFWREGAGKRVMIPMEMAEILFTRAPQFLPKAVNKRTAVRFGQAGKTDLQKIIRMAQIKVMYAT